MHHYCARTCLSRRLDSQAFANASSLGDTDLLLAALNELAALDEVVGIDDGQWTSKGNLSLQTIVSVLSPATNTSILDVRSALSDLAGSNNDPYGEVSEWIWLAQSQGLSGTWIPTPGDMIMRKAGGCQAHYLIGKELKWSSAGASLNVSTNAAILDLAEPVFADIVCPCDAGNAPTCNFNPAHWELMIENPSRFARSGTLYEATEYLMGVFLILKLISLDGSIVDRIAVWLCWFFSCGKYTPDTSGRMDAVMLSFDVLNGKPMLQAFFTEVSKHLRLNVASKVLLMPLTTLGYNVRCPKHVYTKIMDPWLWYIAVSLTMLDAVLIIAYYIAISCFPSLKTKRVLYLPFGLPLLGSMAGVVAGCIYYDFFTAFVGINVTLAFHFNMSPEIHSFQISLLVLSLLEFLGTAMKIVEKRFAVKMSQSREEPQTQDPAGASGITVGKLSCPCWPNCFTTFLKTVAKCPGVEASEMCEEPSNCSREKHSL